MGLEVRNLYKKYGEKVVVDNLCFEMKKPGVYALLGTNGAGKTTSIRMMLGMLAKDGGEVLWNGQPLTMDNCNVGYLAEERGLYPKYSLMDQLMYFAGLRGVSKEEAKRELHTGRKSWGQRNIFFLKKRQNPSWQMSFPRVISRRYSLWLLLYPIPNLSYLTNLCQGWIR